MALSYRAVEVRLQVRDDQGDKVNQTFKIPSSVWDPASDLWADLVTIRDSLVTALNAMIDGLIYQANVVIPYRESAVLAATACDVESRANVVVNLETAGKTGLLRIPAPILGSTSGIFEADSGEQKNIVDKANTELLDFIALFQATGGVFQISDGEWVADTNPVKSGKRVHAKSEIG